MPNRRAWTALMLGVALVLPVGCTSNNTQKRRAGARTAKSQPASTGATVAADPLPPLPAGGPTDPGTRTLPVGQPLGQLAVETPPIPPPPPAPPLATMP